MFDIAQHLRRLAQQQAHWQVDRGVVEIAIAQHQLRVRGGFSEYGTGAALAFAQGLEFLQVAAVDSQHITLLGLVAPHLQWRHARVITGNRTQLKTAATAAVIDQFRQRIGQATGADIVDGDDRIDSAQRPAGIDHFLCPAFHFRIAALH